jgi:hypothetical protein
MFMRHVHFCMLSIVIVSGLAAVLISCARSEAPQPPANNQPTTTQLANTAAPSVATQPSPQQATTASADSGKGKVDACTLLTSKEIQSVQGEALKEAKSSGRSEGGFSTSQCFFTLPTFTNSISLTVTRRGDGPGARDPKQFWKETFHRETESEQARDRDRNKGRERNEGREEEEEKGAPPQKITGVGDEAFWAGSRFGGALYVLKSNAFIRVSVGGTGDQQTKIKKSKALAQMVLKHQ